MTTIDDLRQQLEDLYLEPVIEETPSVPLALDVDSSTDTIKLTDGVLSPDDESAIAPGRLLEMNYELDRILDYDASIKEVTVRRGVRGSEAASHTAATTDVRFPTRWPRTTQAAALREAVGALWQPLFLEAQMVVPASAASMIQLPLNVVRIVSVRYQRGPGDWPYAEFEFFPTHPLDPAFSHLELGPLGKLKRALVSIVYGKRLDVPDDNYTDLDPYPEKWNRIILVDAAAALLAGVDIDSSTQEYLTEQLRLERFPVKSGSTISQNLIRFREYLLNEAAKDLEAGRPRDVERVPISLV